MKTDYTLIVNGVHPSHKSTKDRDARRIAINALNEELIRANERGIFEVVIYGGKSGLKINDDRFFERMVYESAKRLNLVCEPTEGELRKTELMQSKTLQKELRYYNPLKMISEPHHYPYEGPYINILGGANDGKERSDRHAVAGAADQVGDAGTVYEL